jgi:hypothetical protein
MVDNKVPQKLSKKKSLKLARSLHYPKKASLGKLSLLLYQIKYNNIKYHYFTTSLNNYNYITFMVQI